MICDGWFAVFSFVYVCLDAAVSVFVLYLQNIECLSIDSDELLFEDNIAQSCLPSYSINRQAVILVLLQSRGLSPFSFQRPFAI